MEVEPTITIQKEWFLNTMKELAPLFDDEWQEVSAGKETKQELNPAWEKFMQIESSGMLHLLTARVDGKLIGYLMTIIHPHLHFADVIYGFVDGFYVKPEYRDAGVVESLIGDNEDMLRSAGIGRIRMDAQPDMWLYKELKKLHYERTEFVFMKWL